MVVVVLVGVRIPYNPVHLPFRRGTWPGAGGGGLVGARSRDPKGQKKGEIYPRLHYHQQNDLQ